MYSVLLCDEGESGIFLILWCSQRWLAQCQTIGLTPGPGAIGFLDNLALFFRRESGGEEAVEDAGADAGVGQQALFHLGRGLYRSIAAQMAGRHTLFHQRG